MAMKYDPIMCMMVDDTVKTKDAAFIVEAKKQGHPYKAIVNGEDKEIIKYYTHKGFTDIKLTRAKGKDSNTLDKAIRICDVNKEEGFKIYNATVRNDTLYIEYEDLLYGNGKKEKESFTRTEAKKLLNDPWNTWLGTSRMVVKQFVG